MISPEPESSSSRRFSLALAAGTGVVLLLVGLAYLLSRGSAKQGGGQPAPLPFGAAEQAYAPQIHFSEIRLSRAANLLNQEFTYVVGTVENAGMRGVRNVEVSVEFHDLINQIVLRETVRVLPPGAPALRAGERREFQLTFESVPASWNRQAPSFRVTGLALE
jgi:hypothetical protein